MITPAAATYQLEAHYLAGAHGTLFGLHTFPADHNAHTLVVYAPPFGEEMNKSRRQAALQARHFAHAGYAVLQCDLTGCGDSGGELSDADANVWLDDIETALTWLQQRWGDKPMILWGLRLGATLATVLSTRRPTPPHRLLLWQPVTDGQAFLNQFLRVKLASDLLTPGANQPTTVAALWALLQQGTPIEIGGYVVTPALAASLTTLQLTPLTPPAAVTWIDVGAATDAPPLTPTRLAVVAQWQQRGVAVETHGIVGPPFWALQEIAECHELITLSTRCCAPVFGVSP